MNKLIEAKLAQLQMKNIISKGWSGMLFLLFLMMLTDIIEGGMKKDFTLLIQDPGIRGLWFIAFMTITNVCVQMAIYTFEDRNFRWFVFGLTLFYTLFFIGHQLNHILSGEGIDIHFFLDITHHAIGFWATRYAYKWAKYTY